jgi:hypothetical protein
MVRVVVVVLRQVVAWERVVRERWGSLVAILAASAAACGTLAVAVAWGQRVVMVSAQRVLLVTAATGWRRLA